MFFCNTTICGFKVILYHYDSRFVRIYGFWKIIRWQNTSNSKGYEFLDLDYYIEQQEQLSVADLFEKRGHIEFRKLEVKAVQKFVELTQILFSLLEELRLVMVIQ